MYSCLYIVAIVYFFLSFINGQSITSGTLMTSDKQLLLDRHNIWRNFTAQGLTLNQLGTYLPKAVDMNFLFWDDALAEVAQNYADSCTWAHNSNRNTNFWKYSSQASFTLPTDNNIILGENLASSSASEGSLGILISLIDAWYDEHTVFNYEKISSTNYEAIGHFTQLVWSTTRFVGCGYTDCSWGQLLVCNYYPPGNYLGQYPYKNGSSCSSSTCPKDRTKTCQNGLCAGCMDPSYSTTGSTSNPTLCDNGLGVDVSQSYTTTTTTTKSPTTTTKSPTTTTKSPTTTTKSPTTTTNSPTTTTNSPTTTTNSPTTTTKSPTTTTKSPTSTTTPTTTTRFPTTLTPTTADSPATTKPPTTTTKFPTIPTPTTSDSPATTKSPTFIKLQTSTAFITSDTIRPTGVDTTEATDITTTIIPTIRYYDFILDISYSITNSTKNNDIIKNDIINITTNSINVLLNTDGFSHNSYDIDCTLHDEDFSIPQISLQITMTTSNATLLNLLEIYLESNYFKSELNSTLVLYSNAHKEKNYHIDSALFTIINAPHDNAASDNNVSDNVSTSSTKVNMQWYIIFGIVVAIVIAILVAAILTYKQCYKKSCKNNDNNGKNFQPQFKQPIQQNSTQQQHTNYYETHETPCPQLSFAINSKNEKMDLNDAILVDTIIHTDSKINNTNTNNKAAIITASTATSSLKTKNQATRLPPPPPSSIKSMNRPATNHLPPLASSTMPPISFSDPEIEIAL